MNKYVTWSEDVNIVYVRISPTPNGGARRERAARTEPVHPQVNLDFDSNGNLIGVEIL